ncbi:MAG: hypothetical protein R2769_07430 [Saprospiraceae bacterium]
MSITDPCECKNNATTLTNGQFDEVIQVNAPDGQTWTVTAVTGLFASSSPAPPAAPAPISVGTRINSFGWKYLPVEWYSCRCSRIQCNR